MGDYHQSLAFIHKALASAILSWSGSRQMWRNYDTTARVFTLMNFYAAAADYAKEALEMALANKDPSLTYVSYVHLGVVYGKLQNYGEAIKYAQIGFEIAQSLPSDSAGLDKMAYSSLQLGHLYKEAEDFNTAITYYDNAIRLNNELKSEADLYEAHKGKSICYIGLKSDALAEAEIETTLNLFQQNRSKIEEESNRNSFSDDQQNIYDVAVDFEYSRMNNPQKALEYSETNRARSLLDLTGGNAQLVQRNNRPDLLLQFDSKPLNLAQIQERLPAEAQILEYAALSDKLLMWVITRTNFSVAQQNISFDELSEKVLRFLTLFSRPVDDSREEMLRAATELYTILISPVEGMLDSKKLICIIPDKVLNYLPFVALASPNTGRYLVSDYLTVLNPSSNIFLVCTDAALRKEAEKTERTLTVGNPHFDADQFPLPELPSSAKEAEVVAACYASALPLVGQQARESSIKSEMEKSSIIHLASHYIVDERSPMLSKLILAKEPTKPSDKDAFDGVLQAYESYSLNLRRARLVVLSACQTGIEKYYKGEGMIGMSRAFIAAGVPLIVASLWAIDSDSSTELMINFHRYRTRGRLSTVEALRRAQLDMANGSAPRYQHPYY